MNGLHLFTNHVAVAVNYKFLGYTPSSSDVTPIEEGVGQFARLDAWIATFVTCRTVEERRGGHRQNLYADIYASCVSTTIEQQVGHVIFVLQKWRPYKLELANGGKWSCE